MGDNAAEENHHHQVFDVSADVAPAGSTCFDDDGRLKRTGTAWTASAHIITAVIGPELLSLAWATAQLGWIAGPTALFLFSIVTYYTSTLLAACYRSGDPANEERSYTYMDAVSSNLGGMKVEICGWTQYLNLFGVAIGYTNAASISMMAVKRSNCFHASGGKDPCKISSTPYVLAFGAAEILFSQIPDFDQISWLSIVAAVMSFTYSSIGLGLGVAKVAESGKFKGSLTGIGGASAPVFFPPVYCLVCNLWAHFGPTSIIGTVHHVELVETSHPTKNQDTLKSPPSESKTMKKATLISVSVTTLFYMLCACFGYAAFGDLTPGNLLNGFGFYNPFWLLDITNVAIVVHLVCAYQVYCQPLFAFVEKTAAEWFPDLLSVDPVIGAIAAGNAVVLKPPEIAPASSSLFAKLFGEYLDSSALKVVEGNGEVGRIVLAAAAKHLTPADLELGGKCPVIVDSDINLTVTARRIIGGKWGLNNGQVRISADHIITTKDFAPKLIDALKLELEKFFGKDPLISEDLSRIVSSNHFARLTKILDEDKVSGKIVHGGRRNKDSLKIAPTILLDVPKDSLITNEEIFGPLLPIATVDNIEESFGVINSGEKPLAAYLFTNNKTLKEKFVRNVSAGGFAHQ
ncbi:hypothetical protein RHMOL_Rhmol11G0130300 [Rhododendron molle]|uniref:Uncharacterized protein n=1 Tax=Rhododendron molle TaxID=49168 RepID=A0ACC0LSR2_RHOML|nr:hypothetical protein RHMOL_Rhmol11G0130300 [Rhododendron molle]